MNRINIAERGENTGYSSPTLTTTDVEYEHGIALSGYGADGESPDIDGWNEYGEF